MESMNEEVNLRHRTYCVAMGIGEMPLVPYFERGWLDAVNAGINCEDIRMVIADRQRRIRDGVRQRECVYLRNICGSEEAIGNVIMEAAYLKAMKRIKPVDAGKLEVLKATGRVTDQDRTEMDERSREAVPIGKVIEEMRKAAG